jgi:uncharacterized protein YbaR (Trm112 family)
MLSGLAICHNGQQGSYNRAMDFSGPLVDILCCPVSHEPLLPLSAQRLVALNGLVSQGGVQFVDGCTVTDELTGAMITRDGKVIYAIDQGIPVLLPERGIGTTQFKDPL